jgi:hypothetical protein
VICLKKKSGFPRVVLGDAEVARGNDGGDTVAFECGSWGCSLRVSYNISLVHMLMLRLRDRILRCKTGEKSALGRLLFFGLMLMLILLDIDLGTWSGEKAALLLVLSKGFGAALTRERQPRPWRYF